MKVIAPIVTAVFLTISHDVCMAVADGPDHYRVTDVKAGETLTIHNKPDSNADVVGEIPSSGDCIRNLGCRGDLTLHEFTTLSKLEQQQRQKENPRWCEVEYQGTRGWVAGRYLAEGYCADHEGKTAPSFDCSKAESEAEELVCNDTQLALLDQELARLYTLAINDPSLNEKEKKYLRASQRGWIKGRDEAWKTKDKSRYVADAYLLRIGEIRRQQPASRSADSDGISTGPVGYDCSTEPVETCFIHTEPSRAVVYHGDTPFVLTLTPSASGARYVGQYADGTVEFWTRGKEALFTSLDGKELNCIERTN